MGIFDDFFTGFVGGGDGLGGAISGIGGNILNDIILRQTTNEEERLVTGRSLAGDTPFGGGQLGGVLQGLQTIGGGMAGNGLSFAQGLLGGAISQAPCPTTGGVAIAPGTCMTIGDVVAAGGKGMCYVGTSSGGTPILKKMKRRRRRRMFTASDKQDIQWALSVAGTPK